MKVSTAATFLKNVVAFADTDRDGKISESENAALQRSLKPVEKAAVAAMARILPGRTSLVGLQVGAFQSNVERIAEFATFADEAGNNSGRISYSEAKASLLQRDAKSALIAFAKLANSRADPVIMHQQ